MTNRVIEGPANVGAVNGRHKRQVFPVLSFQVIKVLVLRCAVPKIGQENTKVKYKLSAKDQRKTGCSESANFSNLVLHLHTNIHYSVNIFEIKKK